MKSSAKIIADSINHLGNRITTFEVNLPKVLLAEMNTHKMISKNYSSSRAIPNASFTQIESFEPAFYGKNQAGMVAKREEIENKAEAQSIWSSLIAACKEGSDQLAKFGLHKQWSNRPNDWHVMAKGVVTATEFDNFFFLRDHPDAQPEIQELAESMRVAMKLSEPWFLNAGEWHLPYVDRDVDQAGNMVYQVSGQEVDLETAKQVSASCCAQASYRKNDDSITKAESLFKRLIESEPAHLSPVEHQATPIEKQTEPWNPLNWENGITHVRKDGTLCSANFLGWVQFRQTLPKKESWM